MITRLRAAHARGIRLRTTAIVIAQVWRDPAGRQARLARLLYTMDVRDVDERLGREAGVLMGRSGTTDAVDATVVLIAEPGDEIITSDPVDLRRLVGAAGTRVAVIPCADTSSAGFLVGHRSPGTSGRRWTEGASEGGANLTTSLVSYA